MSLVSLDFVCHESDVTIKDQSDVYKDEGHSHEKRKTYLKLFYSSNIVILWFTCLSVYILL